MKNLLLVVIRLSLLAVIGASGCQRNAASGPVIEFEGGYWFNGSAFERKTMYSVDGWLSTERPDRIDTTYNLGDRYVVPPYGEAHNHNLLSDTSQTEQEIEMYLADGVFYAMIQDPIHEVDPSFVAREFNNPSSVDVNFTQGVITPSGGIIAEMYSMLASMGHFGNGKTLSDLDTRNIFLIDNEEDLASKWEVLSSRNNDFIKVIMAFSEEFDLRKGNPAYGFEFGRYSARTGIDPKILPVIVQRAHQDGLRVSVHIETAADFRTAVESGADIIAHLPASWQIGKETRLDGDGLDPWILSNEDALRAASKGTVVITTALVNEDHPEQRKFAAVHKENIATLYRNGVILAFGSDNGGTTSLEEVSYVANLSVLDNLAILKILCEATPRVIFPKRKVGSLTDGFESSFLVLSDNPLKDLSYLKSIALRVKQGYVLN